MGARIDILLHCPRIEARAGLGLDSRSRASFLRAKITKLERSSAKIPAWAEQTSLD
jgi:hypothetical protein